MIDWRKRSNCGGQTLDSTAPSTQAGSQLNNAKVRFSLVFQLALFLQRKFLFAFEAMSPRLVMTRCLSTHQNGIQCCRAAQPENFQKSEPICRTALVENVFCSRQDFPSVLSTEKFTDFSQWNLLEFIGSWLAVTD